MENDIMYQELSDEELGLVVGGAGPGNAQQLNGSWSDQNAIAIAGVAAVALNTNIVTQININVPINISLPHTK
jgi:hypothetical protein